MKRGPPLSGGALSWLRRSSRSTAVRPRSSSTARPATARVTDGGHRGSEGSPSARAPTSPAIRRSSSTPEAGVAGQGLGGSWFNDGFAGAMGELLCAIEEDREPLNSARGNLHSLQHMQGGLHWVVAGAGPRFGESTKHSSQLTPLARFS